MSQMLSGGGANCLPTIIALHMHYHVCCAPNILSCKSRSTAKNATPLGPGCRRQGRYMPIMVQYSPVTAAESKQLHWPLAWRFHGVDYMDFEQLSCAQVS